MRHSKSSVKSYLSWTRVTPEQTVLCDDTLLLSTQDPEGLMPQLLCQIQPRYPSCWVVPTSKSFPQQEHRIRRWFATSSFFKILFWFGGIDLVTSLPHSSEFPHNKKTVQRKESWLCFQRPQSLLDLLAWASTLRKAAELLLDFKQPWNN